MRKKYELKRSGEDGSTILSFTALCNGNVFEFPIKTKCNHSIHLALINNGNHLKSVQLEISVQDHEGITLTRDYYGRGYGMSVGEMMTSIQGWLVRTSNPLPNSSTIPLIAELNEFRKAKPVPIYTSRPQAAKEGRSTVARMAGQLNSLIELRRQQPDIYNKLMNEQGTETGMGKMMKFVAEELT